MSALIGHGSVTSLPLQKIMTDHWTNQATGGHGSSQESSFPINAARTESKAMALIFEMIILLHFMRMDTLPFDISILAEHLPS